MFVFGFVSFCCSVVFRSVLVIVVAVAGFASLVCAGCVLLRSWPLWAVRLVFGD